MSSSESYLSAIAAFSCGFAITGCAASGRDPVIRGGGGLAPKEPGSITERSPLCGVSARCKPSQARTWQLFCACHSQKGRCFAHRSNLDVRGIVWRATNERPKDEMPGLNQPERFTCETSLSGSHVYSSKVSASRMGHGASGKDRHTCRSPRPTAVVSLGLFVCSSRHRGRWSLRLSGERDFGARVATGLRENSLAVATIKRDNFQFPRPAALGSSADWTQF